jgi:protein-tyrosine phosphatase
MWRFDGIINFRDIGGHPASDGRRMRAGRFFRSGHLAHATDDDLATLVRMGISTILDLQDPGDVAVHGEDRIPTGATLRRVPNPVEQDEVGAILRLVNLGSAAEISEAFPPGSAYTLMMESCAGWPTDPGRSCQARAVIRHVILHSNPVLIHCGAGKDRAGFVSAVLQLAAGVDDETIVTDYLRSNDSRVNHNNDVLDSLVRRGVSTDLLLPLMVQHEDYIRRFLASLRETWGEMDHYLSHGLGLEVDEIAALRERLLDEDRQEDEP